jgi:PST family polysaccharide transporter
LLRKILTHRLSRNAGALALLQLVTYITPVLALVHLTRVLGIELYGVLAFGIALTQFFYGVLDLGFTLSATQKIAVRREKKGYVARLIGAIFAIKAITLVLIAAGIALYAASSEKYHGHLDFFLLTLIPLTALCFLPTWFFAGIERMFYITIFTIVSKFLYLTMILAFVRSPDDFLWAPIADGVSQAIGTAIGIYLIYHSGYFIRVPRFRDIRYAARLTRDFFVSRVAANIFGWGGVMLLGIFGTPAMTAIYSLAERFYQAMQYIFSPVFGAMYPYMARERNIGLLLKIAAVCVVGACIVGFVAAWVGPHLIAWWLGPDWSEASQLLGVFALAIVIDVLLGMSGYPLSAILGTMRTANLSVVYGAVFYALCACLVIASGHVNALSFAWMLCLTELSILVYRAIKLWPKAYRLLNQPRPA